MNRFKAAFTAFMNPNFLGCKIIVQGDFAKDMHGTADIKITNQFVNSGDKVAIGKKYFVVQDCILRVKEAK